MRLNWEVRYPSSKPGQHWRFSASVFPCVDAILILMMSWFSGSPNLSPNPMSPAHNNLGKHVILRSVCNYSQGTDILMMMLFLEVVRFWWGCEHRSCASLLIFFTVITVVHINSIWNKAIWTYIRVKWRNKKCWQTPERMSEGLLQKYTYLITWICKEYIRVFCWWVCVLVFLKAAAWV